MKINLSQIKPSPNPVRTTWDEDKMNELAQSIKEQGLIVPIKVRPNGSGYEIVYGHRRVEASRRAGLAEVEAIVEGMDDDNAQWQALIENLQRADLSPLNKSNALQERKNKGYTVSEIALRTGYSISHIRQVLRLQNEPEEIKQFIQKIGVGDKQDETAISAETIRVVRESGIDNDLGTEIIKKAAKEQLSHEQGRKIADAIKAAPTPQAKKKLLEWEYSPTIHDPELIKERAKTHGAHDPIYRDNKPSPQKAFDDSPEVKMLIDGVAMAIKTFVDLMKQIQTVADIGKLAPEGKQFMTHKLRSFRKQLDTLIDELEGNDG